MIQSKGVLYWVLVSRRGTASCKDVGLLQETDGVKSETFSILKETTFLGLYFFSVQWKNCPILSTFYINFIYLFFKIQ